MSELEKKGSAIFYSRPLMKVDLTRENGRNLSNTGSKNYVWLLVRRILGNASERQMLPVKAVWVMPSVIGCHKLSTPIRKAKPNISDGRTSRNIFAASFDGKNPGRNNGLYKKFFKTFHDLSQFVNAMTRIKKIKFREEMKAAELTKLFEQFRPI